MARRADCYHVITREKMDFKGKSHYFRMVQKFIQTCSFIYVFISQTLLLMCSMHYSYVSGHYIFYKVICLIENLDSRQMQQNQIQQTGEHSSHKASSEMIMHLIWMVACYFYSLGRLKLSYISFSYISSLIHYGIFCLIIPLAKSRRQKAEFMQKQK